MLIPKRKPAAPASHRLELADAIANHAAATARRNATLAAEGEADEIVWRARGAVSSAEGELKKAATQRAQDALAEARRAHESAIDRRDEINRGRTDLDWAASSGERSLDAAVSAVLQAELPDRAAAVAKRVLGLQRELAAATDELKFLVEVRAFPQREGYTGPEARPSEDIQRLLNRTDKYGPQNVDLTDLLPSPPPSQRWKDAAAALRTDAAAPIKELS